MTVVIDDIYNWLYDVWFMIYQQLISPFLCVLTHFLKLIYINFALNINVLIGCFNFLLNTYNLIANMIHIYFAYFPEIWSTPIVAAIMANILIAGYWLVKRHIPTMGGR